MPKHNQHYQITLCSFDCYKSVTADKHNLKYKYKGQKFKGHLLWKIHFCMMFEHKSVLAVCEQNHPRMMKIHPVFFLQSQ